MNRRFRHESKRFDHEVLGRESESGLGGGSVGVGVCAGTDVGIAVAVGLGVALGAGSLGSDVGDGGGGVGSDAGSEVADGIAVGLLVVWRSASGSSDDPPVQAIKNRPATSTVASQRFVRFISAPRFFVPDSSRGSRFPGTHTSCEYGGIRLQAFRNTRAVRRICEKMRDNKRGAFISQGV